MEKPKFENPPKIDVSLKYPLLKKTLDHEFDKVSREGFLEFGLRNQSGIFHYQHHLVPKEGLSHLIVSLERCLLKMKFQEYQ